VLGPGHEFSFNDIVGERTAARGYQLAHIYNNGEVIDGIGGGICQVSSTLYNAILYTSLEVTERHNHQFTVSYVPYGQDATVSYGYVDFKFRNNTAFPLRIECIIEKIDDTQSSIEFKLIGTSDDVVQVEIRNRVIEERPFKTIVTYDNTKPVGYVKVVDYGSKGYIIETFKKLIINGKLVSDSRLHISYYQALSQKEIHGSMVPPQ
jgi:vancomycin resistance protein YoaR